MRMKNGVKKSPIDVNGEQPNMTAIITKFRFDFFQLTEFESTLSAQSSMIADRGSRSSWEIEIFIMQFDIHTRSGYRYEYGYSCPWICYYFSFLMIFQLKFSSHLSQSVGKAIFNIIFNWSQGKLSSYRLSQWVFRLCILCTTWYATLNERINT